MNVRCQTAWCQSQSSYLCARPSCMANEGNMFRTRVVYDGNIVRVTSVAKRLYRLLPSTQQHPQLCGAAYRYRLGAIAQRTCKIAFSFPPWKPKILISHDFYYAKRYKHLLRSNNFKVFKLSCWRIIRKSDKIKTEFFHVIYENNSKKILPNSN